MANPKLELFYYDSCPFCQFVLSTVKELNLKVEYRNVLENREDLEFHVKTTGRQTVPCLYVDGSPMFESNDINEWLKSNQSKLDQNG